MDSCLMESLMSTWAILLIVILVVTTTSSTLPLIIMVSRISISNNIMVFLIKPMLRTVWLQFGNTSRDNIFNLGWCLNPPKLGSVSMVLLVKVYSLVFCGLVKFVFFAAMQDKFSN